MGCLNVTSKRCGEGLRIEASMVCTVNIRFVKLSKEYVWLTPYNGYRDDIDISSNVKWEIE